MSQPFKILIATGLFPPDIGGPATYAKILNEELPQRGFRVKILSFGEVRHLPKIIRHLAYALKVWRALPGVDLVYALDPVSVGLPVYLACLLRRRTYWLRVAGDYAWEQGIQRFGVEAMLDEFSLSPRNYAWPVRILKRIQTRVARGATQVITPSHYLKKIVSNWGIASTKIQVIYNAFENKILPLDSPRSINSENPTIISVGRLVPWKGFSTLIALVPKLLIKNPGLHLLIVGDGPDQTILKEQIVQFNLGANVKLLGRLNQSDLFTQIGQADLFVLNTAYEGFSHQLLEVMALGVPIITTNIGGNPELIESGQTGLLVPYDDKRALAEAIERLAFDSNLRHRLAQAAQLKVSTFTKIRLIDELVDLLKQHENFKS